MPCQILFLKQSQSYVYSHHRSQRGSYNCLNCYMKVVCYIFSSTPGVVRIHFRANPRIQVFWENQFFSFCGAPRNNFWPQKPFLTLRADFAQKWLGHKKFFRGPIKWKKLIFSKNLSSRICPKVDSDYPRGTCENVVYHSHVTIQTILTSYLRPVIYKSKQN